MVGELVWVLFFFCREIFLGLFSKIWGFAFVCSSAEKNRSKSFWNLGGLF